MDKAFWRSFLGFLDDASDAEIQSRLAETRNFIQTARSPEVRSDARRMIALMEQELLARTQVKAARRS
jgi:hypothetical protein